MVTVSYNNIPHSSPNITPHTLNDFHPSKMCNTNSMDFFPEIAAAAKVEKKEIISNSPPKSLAIENDNLLIMDGDVIDNDDYMTAGSLVTDDEQMYYKIKNNNILNVEEMDNYDIDSKINTDLEINDGENESTDEDESNVASEGRDEINEESKYENITDQQIDIETQGYLDDGQLLVNGSVDDGIDDDEKNNSHTAGENIQPRKEESDEDDNISMDISNHESDDEIIQGNEIVF